MCLTCYFTFSSLKLSLNVCCSISMSMQSWMHRHGLSMQSWMHRHGLSRQSWQHPCAGWTRATVAACASAHNLLQVFSIRTSLQIFSCKSLIKKSAKSPAHYNEKYCKAVRWCACLTWLIFNILSLDIRIVWKVSGKTGKFPDSLESFRMPCNFLDSFQTVLNDSRNFLYVVKAIYAILAYMSRNKNLRTSSGKFLRVKVCRPERWDFLGLLPWPQSFE